MKKLTILLLASLLALITASCDMFDDSDIRDSISKLESRVSSLEEQMNSANGNISGILEIVNSIKGKEMVSSVSETDNAWTITFANGKVVTISKVHSPVVGIKQDSDGVYYWTLDGNWLLDGNGNKMPVSGKDGNDGNDGKDGKDGNDGNDGQNGSDGITPKLKIEDGFWMVSTDGGATWTKLSKATGEDGKDGESFFSKIEEDELHVYLTLTDGSVLVLPKSDILTILDRVQSIQYVPDFEDGKITVNSVQLYCWPEAVFIDQPTEITYQILPAQYAGKIAEQIRSFYVDNDWAGIFTQEVNENLDEISGPEWRALLKKYGKPGSIAAWFDVRQVSTRAGGERDLNCGMKIIDIVSADDNSGEITFKVLPVNIASENFAASGLTPMYDIGLTDSKGAYIAGWSPLDGWTEAGRFRAEDPYNINKTLTMPVWNLLDLQAWQGRSAFAVQLRMYQLQNREISGLDENGRQVYKDYENELASAFTALYPDVTPVELLPDPYIPDENGELLPVNDGEEHQYLPYNALRQNGTENEPGYRSILYGLTPAFQIGGSTVSAAEAYKMGYLLFDIELAWDSFTYSDNSLEDLVIGTGQVYAEVEMNPYKSEEERRAAIGGTVTGRYTLTSPFGKKTISGTVEITDAPGSPDDPDLPGPDAGYDFLHNSNYTFNSKMGDGSFIQKYDFASNDGRVEWWTRVNPAYYTRPASNSPGSMDRISFRHALADYATAAIDLASLAFNVVDCNDRILSDQELEDAGLEVKFEYADDALGAKLLPASSQTAELRYYKDLWQGNTSLLFRTNEMPFIPVKASLFKKTGNSSVELPTRFSTPRASVEYPSDILDYSSFAVVNWLPFGEITCEDVRIVLNGHKQYRIPLAQSINLKDSRPGGISYNVIENGQWVTGNVSSWDISKGTYSSSDGKDPNGYIDGISSKDAYHLGDLEFDMEAIKAKVSGDLRRLISFVYSYNGKDFSMTPMDGATPYLSFDYYSGIQFNGSISIPVHVELPNPWQPALVANYTINIVSEE